MYYSKFKQFEADTNCIHMTLYQLDSQVAIINFLSLKYLYVFKY